jgi:hypothetical protein
MKQFLEFVIPVDWADYLPAGVGARDESVVRVRCRDRDPVLKLIRSQELRTRKSRSRFAYSSFVIRREYTAAEVRRARFFLAKLPRVFEPCGEECGTEYDDRAECKFEIEPARSTSLGGSRSYEPPEVCGAGFKQISRLRLRASSVPRGVDFARTIADEVIVSHRVVRAFRSAQITGVEFAPVELKAFGKKLNGRKWYQLRFIGHPIEFHDNTKARSLLFDRSTYGRCPHGHLIGASLITEPFLRRRSMSQDDIHVSRQLLGWHAGLLRPAPAIFVSARTRRLVQREGLKGMDFEIARIR